MFTLLISTLGLFKVQVSKRMLKRLLNIPTDLSDNSATCITLEFRGQVSHPQVSRFRETFSFTLFSQRADGQLKTNAWRRTVNKSLYIQVYLLYLLHLLSRKLHWERVGVSCATTFGTGNWKKMGIILINRSIHEQFVTQNAISVLSCSLLFILTQTNQEKCLFRIYKCHETIFCTL